MRYLLIDTLNMFHRASHIVRGRDAYEKSGMALHVTLSAIAQSWRLFNADHVVVALECSNSDNWRREYDIRYKANRQAARAAQTPREKEESDIMFAALNDFLDFLATKTNVTVLQCPVAEADDMIAQWIHNHKDDEHILVSTDKDFRQLIAENVIQFNGVDKKIFASTKSHLGLQILLEDKIPREFKYEEVEDPAYLLFEKIVRGDSGDNVFSAFPGVRKNSAKDKPGLNKAYEDRQTQGYEWNNFMMAKWTDHNGEDHLVRDDFTRNTLLVDLSAHPKEIKEIMNDTINLAIEAKNKERIGFHFFQFCNRHELEQLEGRAEEISKILAAPYV